MKNKDYFIFLRKQPPRKSYSAICDNYSSMGCISIPIILSLYPEYHIPTHSLGGVLQKRCPSILNFAKFTGNHLCQSLFFTKVAALSKKRLWHRCFPVNFAKFLGTPLLQNTSGGCFCRCYCT